MLSQILRQDVETYVTELKESCALLRQAHQGAISPEAIGVYLAGLRYLTHEGVQLLKLAALSAERARDASLAQHFARKVAEEVGHSRWAESDISKLEHQFTIRVNRDAPPALCALTSFLSNVVRSRPAHFLAYALLVEHMTVLVGPEWIQALERNSGIPQDGLSVVGNHVEHDRDHVLEGLQEIDTLVDSAELDGMRQTIRTSCQHISNFFNDVFAIAVAA